ncbi:hypothetical protein BH11PAT1_BH11PAT1_0830 [soil metagenome]
MKLILIDGGPASGKNTLGKLLVDDLNAQGDKSILLDHDTYIEELCPTWIWEHEHQKENDLLSATVHFIKDIDKFLKEDFNVVAIGVRFLSQEDVALYIKELAERVSVYLYHLSVPFILRKQRLDQRGPHSLIDLEKDQEDRDAITSWPGYIYQNINSPEVDAKELMKLIQTNIGLIAV